MDNSSAEIYNITMNNTTHYNVARIVCLTIILGVVVIATVIGNVLVIFAVFYEYSLRTVTNYFIVSLAMSDLMIGVLVLPFSATYEILSVWIFGQGLCIFWCATDVLCCTASILNLVAISLDRYLAISRPMHYPNLSTARRAGLIILLVWVLSVLVSIPPLFGWRKERTDPSQCELTGGKGYVIYSAMGSFYIPLAIMLFVYSRIYVVAERHTKQIKKANILGTFNDRMSCDSSAAIVPSDWASVDGHRKGIRLTNSVISHESLITGVQEYESRALSSKKVRKFTKEKRAAKTLAIVVGAFVICWFPFFSAYLIREVCVPCHIPELLFRIVFWLGYCNSFLNPIIYPCLNKDFKKAFRKLICRTYCSVTKLDYYGSPRRTVRPIRASRRLRLSIVPSSSNSTPPDSPQIALARRFSRISGKDINTFFHNVKPEINHSSPFSNLRTAFDNGRNNVHIEKYDGSPRLSRKTVNGGWVHRKSLPIMRPNYTKAFFNLPLGILEEHNELHKEYASVPDIKQLLQKIGVPQASVESIGSLLEEVHERPKSPDLHQCLIQRDSDSNEGEDTTKNAEGASNAHSLETNCPSFEDCTAKHNFKSSHNSPVDESELSWKPFRGRNACLDCRRNNRLMRSLPSLQISDSYSTLRIHPCAHGYKVKECGSKNESNTGLCSRSNSASSVRVFISNFHLQYGFVASKLSKHGNFFTL